LLAFAIIYFVWGSTFLAIRVGVREVPPLILAAMRFLVAGHAGNNPGVYGAIGNHFPANTEAHRRFGSVLLVGIGGVAVLMSHLAQLVKIF